MSIEVTTNMCDVSRDALSEIARMSYGRRLHEGTSGGNGNIGAYVDATSGRMRIVKFNTHKAERNAAGDPTASQIGSANALRAQLLQIARNYGVNDAKMAEIRSKLGLPAEGDVQEAQTLLKRTVVAKVVKMIDSKIWDHALKGHDMSSYSSKNVDTTFACVVSDVLFRGKEVKDLPFAANLVSRTNEELRNFSQFAEQQGMRIDASLGTTIHNTVDEALKVRLEKPSRQRSAEDCGNLARNAVVLSLLVHGQNEKALAYINHVTGQNYESLDATPFSLSASSLKAVRNVCGNMLLFARRTAYRRAVISLLTDKDADYDVLKGFGDPITNKSFSTGAALDGAGKGLTEFRAGNLIGPNADYVRRFEAREKVQPMPPPVSKDKETVNAFKSVKGVFGKGPMTVPFTDAHLKAIKEEIASTVKTALKMAVDDPRNFNKKCYGQIARDMDGVYQMIYGGKLSLHPGTVNDQEAINAIRDDLKKVFTRVDGTVDEDAMNAFASLGHQGLYPMLCVEYGREHPDESEFPVYLEQPKKEHNKAQHVFDTMICVDRGCKPDTYRVTFRTFVKGGMKFCMNLAEQGKMIYLDPNDKENYFRYDCTFDYKMGKDGCEVTFPEDPTVSVNLKEIPLEA